MTGVQTCALPILYIKAFGNGNTSAIAKIGDCYYYGRGVDKSYEKAVEYYRIGADKGNAYAQYSLGYCYEQGQGVKSNRYRAIDWYKKAAAQGNESAEKALKKMGEG